MSFRNHNISAVIPIGGKGSRLKDVTGKVPKPLFPINGKSALFRCCEELKNNGIENIFVTVGYESEECLSSIMEIKKKLSINIDTFVEKEPMGECGALWHIKEKLTNQFLFVNGDLILSISFKKLLEFHNRLDSQLTLVTHLSDHPYDSDLVGAPNGSQIEKISSKDKNNHTLSNLYLGFTGIAVVDKKLLKKINAPLSIDSSSLFHHLVKKSFFNKIRIYSYNTTEYIKDMGTPDRFKSVENDLKVGKVKKNNYNFPQKALFLDRDNTLISCEKGQYVTNVSQIKFITKNIEKIAEISNEFNFVCLVTNQPQISMGILSVESLDSIHSKLILYCLKYKLKIDVISFCPHHPHSGFSSEIKYLKKDCFCRKPNPGMIFEQAFLRNIDLKKSLFIGDSLDDMYAAKNSGMPFKNISNL